MKTQRQIQQMISKKEKQLLKIIEKTSLLSQKYSKLINEHRAIEGQLDALKWVLDKGEIE